MMKYVLIYHFYCLCAGDYPSMSGVKRVCRRSLSECVAAVNYEFIKTAYSPFFHARGFTFWLEWYGGRQFTTI